MVQALLEPSPPSFIDHRNLRGMRSYSTRISEVVSVRNVLIETDTSLLPETPVQWRLTSVSVSDNFIFQVSAMLVGHNFR